MAKGRDRFLLLEELTEVLGLRENSLKLLASTEGFPLRRVLGALDSELTNWIKGHPGIEKSAADKLQRRLRARRSTVSAR